MGDEALQVSEHFEAWANLFLTWVGFGTLTGLFAKAIMPGRDPGGPIATLAMGIGGSVIGCGMLSLFFEGTKVSPLSPLGFAVATGGAFMILFFYRLLSGHVIDESHPSTAPRRMRLYSHRRRSDRSAADRY
ncbi:MULTISPECIES: GlsB/YeaQ/YmgE family stress response membrane protein [Pirellulaceae]|uniref:GlsB/YeaQ/YmgE family stress response membrane protein n=1 Tax=Pirellulaceae TaxID=2691357 RepID=UPI0018EB6662|nr:MULTISPECIES: GlsB/YeaQ/YmgE family stress response membrane protein [Pirellulaceae]